MGKGGRGSQTAGEFGAVSNTFDEVDGEAGWGGGEAVD